MTTEEIRELLIAYAKFENGDDTLYVCDEDTIDKFIEQL